jgi:hypothetical protein
MSQEPVTITIPECGCTWHGDALVHECERSRQIHERLEQLHEAGRVDDDEWRQLKAELEREHTR